MNSLRPRHVTAQDVARRAGVSQSAVSRAFTPGASISDDLRERVRSAAVALGYRPNAIARSLITARSRIIGIVAAYLQNHFYPDVLDALSRALQARGYHVLLFTADLSEAADPVLDGLLRYRVDGVVLASTTLSSDLAGECRAAGIPVLLFNRTSDVASVSSVTGENRRGGRLIGELLAAGGHERIAYIAGIENSSTSRDRERGLLEGLAAQGRALFAREAGHYRFDGAADAARRLFSRPDRPDAVFAANDHMAIAAMGVATAEFGLRIPEDVAFVGFDDVEAARWPAYSLTTFSQPIAPMVAAVTDLLLSQVEEPDSTPRHVVVTGDLVERGSTRRRP
jgi:DNA-binding LacI/PurR family transcriptional regulator